jgi:hypothetical protein
VWKEATVAYKKVTLAQSTRWRPQKSFQDNQHQDYELNMELPKYKTRVLIAITCRLRCKGHQLCCPISINLFNVDLWSPVFFSCTHFQGRQSAGTTQKVDKGLSLYWVWQWKQKSQSLPWIQSLPTSLWLSHYGAAITWIKKVPYIKLPYIFCQGSISEKSHFFLQIFQMCDAKYNITNFPFTSAYKIPVHSLPYLHYSIKVISSGTTDTSIAIRHICLFRYCGAYFMIHLHKMFKDLLCGIKCCEKLLHFKAYPHKSTHSEGFNPSYRFRQKFFTTYKIVNEKGYCQLTCYWTGVICLPLLCPRGAVL